MAQVTCVLLGGGGPWDLEAFRERLLEETNLGQTRGCWNGSGSAARSWMWRGGERKGSVAWGSKTSSQGQREQDEKSSQTAARSPALIYHLLLGNAIKKSDEPASWIVFPRYAKPWWDSELARLMPKLSLFKLGAVHHTLAPPSTSKTHPHPLPMRHMLCGHSPSWPVFVRFCTGRRQSSQAWTRVPGWIRPPVAVGLRKFCLGDRNLSGVPWDATYSHVRFRQDPGGYRPWHAQHYHLTSGN